MHHPETIANHFEIDGEIVSCEAIGTGLIHKTWKVNTARSSYVLQNVNENVFKNPADIDYNIQVVCEHLGKKQPLQTFPKVIRSRGGNNLEKLSDGYYRMFEWIEGSYTINVVQNSEQAYQAAKQFGKFTRNLRDLDPGKLRITIPGFHDLSLRFEQFITITRRGNPQRIQDCCEEIDALMEMRFILDKYKSIVREEKFRIRVTHHDTKISNVLFDKDDTGICVIDLDTVMPGYFISDVGDMMRTYLSPANEEEKDYSLIRVRKEFYESIVAGYSEEMGEELTDEERDSFFYSGQFMIYMQALRFMTDHLNDDKYYGASYEGHNLVRAMNQLELLRRYNEM